MLSKVVDMQARDQTENLAKETLLAFGVSLYPNSCAWVLSTKHLPTTSSTQSHLRVQVLFRW